jgi:hypothetical protein
MILLSYRRAADSTILAELFQLKKRLTSFLTLGIAKFSAFLIPRVVSSLRDVCAQFRTQSLSKKQPEPARQALPVQTKHRCSHNEKHTTQMLANEANDNMIKCMAKRSLKA